MFCTFLITFKTYQVKSSYHKYFIEILVTNNLFLFKSKLLKLFNLSKINCIVYKGYNY